MSDGWQTIRLGNGDRGTWPSGFTGDKAPNVEITLSGRTIGMLICDARPPLNNRRRLSRRAGPRVATRTRRGRLALQRARARRRAVIVAMRARREAHAWEATAFRPDPPPRPRVRVGVPEQPALDERPRRPSARRLAAIRRPVERADERRTA